MSARRPSAGALAGGLKHAAPLFAALGDETRLWMVARLSTEGPLSIARLTDGAGVTRQAITKHLHVLSEAGMVRSLRQGRESLWEFEPGQLDEARRCLARISQQWDESLGRLKQLVEKS